MKTVRLSTIALIFSLCFYAISASAENLTGASLNWEPYIGETMPREGYVAEVVKEAFSREGYNLEIQYMPWARVVALSKEGRFDVYFPEYYAEELKEDFLISDPFPGGPLVFFQKKGANITYNSMEDLRSYKIGVVRGYVNTPEFDAAEYLTKDPVTEDMQNILKLLAGRIDLMVVDKYVGLHLLRTQVPDRVNEIEIVEPPLGVNDLYVCFPKNTKDAEKRLKAFNNVSRPLIKVSKN
ncbi:polar amino acid transport system substrate-binding protein [Desulfobotulus alkaliphilus]|uniref:Polar amino acid transport system substrate-binding protein n=1 Tax=Desulfobotulus alkaliphilus TaxID=622671 RepID=A0A562RMP9_9BACT|nr:transporter substrate-binding domain-containing protein [Desulfobotulus alkaliphilus]TWI70325.1 polar amino acid transport system substrate-binding protein [Desulfobotulus alkaliphilus]